MTEEVRKLAVETISAWSLKWNRAFVGNEGPALVDVVETALTAHAAAVREGAIRGAAEKLEQRAVDHGVAADKWTPPRSDEDRKWIKEFESRQNEALSCVAVVRALLAPPAEQPAALAAMRGGS